MYDVIVIGAGPAGAGAAVYCQRAGLETLVVEGSAPGGQVSTTDVVENYPGFESIEGYELATKFAKHIKSCGAAMKFEKVVKVELDGETKRVCTNKNEYEARAVVVCHGTKRRTLGVDGEDKLVGRGLSYCAVCDGGFYRGKTTVVVGGGDTAVGDAVYLSRLCEKVYIVHRREEFRAARSKIAALDECSNVERVLEASVADFMLDDSGRLRGVKVNTPDGVREIDADGLFVAVGSAPDTEMYKGVLELDNNGYIVTDESMRTSIPLVYAAGDVRAKLVRQIVTAASDGAIAGVTCSEELR
ncbi:MAG: FAD-dependent oxidoreductase [Clostridiales bacterium]|nr:FAD-dependent oxidoreductase [Clostridiales bacterium]